MWIYKRDKESMKTNVKQKYSFKKGKLTKILEISVKFDLLSYTTRGQQNNEMFESDFSMIHNSARDNISVTRNGNNIKLKLTKKTDELLLLLLFLVIKMHLKFCHKQLPTIFSFHLQWDIRHSVCLSKGEKERRGIELDYQSILPTANKS